MDRSFSERVFQIVLMIVIVLAVSLEGGCHEHRCSTLYSCLFHFEIVWIEIGAGPDLYSMWWKIFSPLLPLIVVLAVLSSLLPAIRAARLKVTESLRYE